MTRTLPGVLAQAGEWSARNVRATSRLISKADGLLLVQVPELAHVPSSKRPRYWRCLL